RDRNVTGVQTCALPIYQNGRLAFEEVIVRIGGMMLDWFGARCRGEKQCRQTQNPKGFPHGALHLQNRWKIARYPRRKEEISPLPECKSIWRSPAFNSSIASGTRKSHPIPLGPSPPRIQRGGGSLEKDTPPLLRTFAGLP